MGKDGGTINWEKGFRKEDGGIKNERIRDEYEGSRDIENDRIMNEYKVMLG